MYNSVLNQLQRAGLLVDAFEADTTAIVRCKVEGDTGKKTSGWYRIFSVLSKVGNTYYVGSYGNWKNGALPEKGVPIEFEGKGLTDEDREAIKQKQREAQQAADRERKSKSQEAAQRAAKIWAGLPTEGRSDYLARKKVAGFGLGYSRGSVVVPVRRVGGALVGLQFIDPEGTKKFLTGTPKAGAFHLLGNIEQAQYLLIAEGYATGASLHMACGYPVAVAFDAGNMVKVAEALRKAYPGLGLVIAADNDATGIKYAQQAVKKVGGILCVPDFAQFVAGGEQPAKPPTDFNDLHALQGLEVVAEQIQASISTPTTGVEVKRNTQTLAASASPDNEKPHSGYIVLDSGVYWIDPNGDDGQTRYRICGRLDVLARARTVDRRDYGLMVAFSNFDGDRCELFLPQRLFGSDRPSQILECLLDRGFEIDSHRKSKGRLVEYLQSSKPSNVVCLINRFGWFDNAYVSPLGVIGDPVEPLHFYSDRKLLNRAAVAGTLAGWRDNIAAKCVGNPLLMFAVSIPFAGPMLEWLSMRTIGFHMVGPSSLGKSTLSAVAGSVCGGADYFRTWNTTAAALETTAAEHSDSVLILDEINQADPFTVGQTVYQLGNEEGRARATDTGSSTRAQHKWRLVWLSNGERSLKEIQSRVGKVTEAGMEMRLLHIQADLHTNQKDRDAKGIYQDLHGFAHGAALSEQLKLEVAKNHGHPFTAFVEWLASATGDERKKMVGYLHRKIQAFGHQHLSENASGQARRAAMGFALVGECGELATRQGITGWQEGDARKAAAMLFKNFLDDRGGEGNAEDRAILEQICLELQTKGESHFTRWDRAEATVDTHQPRSMTRWGYRKVEDGHQFGNESYSEEEFFIFNEVFRKELCKGFSHKRACDLLKERGALVTTKGKGFLYQKVLPGTGRGQTQVYYIKMSALQELVPEIDKEKSDLDDLQGAA